jgi:hypothetical protein
MQEHAQFLIEHMRNNQVEYEEILHQKMPPPMSNTTNPKDPTPANNGTDKGQNKRKASGTLSTALSKKTNNAPVTGNLGELTCTAD